MIRLSVPIYLLGFLLLFCIACSNADDAQQHNANQNEDEVPLVEEATFRATVVEADPGLMVTPHEDEGEARSADLITVGTKDATLLDQVGNEINLSSFKVGMKVEITYDGMIMESYPAQIRSFQVKIIEEE